MKKTIRRLGLVVPSILCLAVAGTRVWADGAESWGNNFYGQLGNGTTTNSSTPVAVSGLSSGVTAIAAGGNHSLAIQNGAVYAWGYNGFGQLGNGTTTFSESTPVAVSGLSSGVTAIAGGGEYSLAIQNGRGLRLGIQRIRPTGQRDDDQ